MTRVERRIDSPDPRIIQLEEGLGSESMAEAAPSGSAWDYLPCAPASKPSCAPSSSSVPKVFTHWNRLVDRTILRVSSNFNVQVALDFVQDFISSQHHTRRGGAHLDIVLPYLLPAEAQNSARDQALAANARHGKHNTC